MATTEPPYRPYGEIRDLVERHGGTMVPRPMGRGIDWVITLYDKTVAVPVRNQNVNALDYFYPAKVPNPKTWDDYDPDAPLLEGAFWKLIDLVLSSNKA